MKKKNSYDTVWSPKEYLAQYYLTKDIADDEYHIINFIIYFFKSKNIKFEKMIEIGCGPTIHHAIPFVPYVKKIILAEYLKGNLEEIRKWLKKKVNAHNWSQYLNGIISLEGSSSRSLPIRRANALRKKISKLILCNVFDKKPIKINEKFPLISSFYCLECVCASKKQWIDAMNNVSSLLDKKGWVIMSALHDTNKYLVHGEKFPVVRLKENDVRDYFINNNFDPKSIKIKVCASEMWISEGFDSILVFCAQKN